MQRTVPFDDLPEVAALPPTCIGVTHGSPAACMPTLLSSLCATAVKQAAAASPAVWVLLPRSDGDGLTRDLSPSCREPRVMYTAWTDPRDPVPGLRDTVTLLQTRAAQGTHSLRLLAFFGVRKVAALREAWRLFLRPRRIHGMVLFPKLPRLWDSAWCSAHSRGPSTAATKDPGSSYAHFVLLPCASRDDATLLAHDLHLQMAEHGEPLDDATAVAFRNAHSLYQCLSHAWFRAGTPQPLLLSLAAARQGKPTYSLVRVALPALQPAAKAITTLRL